MEKIKDEIRFCVYCMKKHRVDIVKIFNTEIFKDKEVSFDTIYQYCPIEDSFLETEEMIKRNSLAMKHAYKKLKYSKQNKEYITIFLDIDGVLNSWGIGHEDKETIDIKDIEEVYLSRFSGCMEDLHKTNVENFNELIDKLSIRYNIQIVISSSWRQFLDLEGFRKLFELSGIQGYISGVLEQYPMKPMGENFDYERFDREKLISSWIKKNDIREYLILDDDEFGFTEEGLGKNFYQTDVDQGLTKEDVVNIMNKFKEESIC